MDLHQKFVQLGTQRKNLTRQLQALLPAIDKQNIYLQHGCANIFEYAWKFAGFSKFLVEKVIRVAKHLENKPCLQSLIEKEGIHKVAMVATIATPETDKIFAKHVENMSKPALFELAKETRHAILVEGIKCCAVPEKIKIELDDEMQILFLKFKKELKKEFGCEFSHKEALRIMLRKLEKSGLGAKHNIVKRDRKVDSTAKNETRQHVPGNGIVGRYIQAEKKREILQKYNYKCAYPNCQNPYDVIHHRDRFSLSKSHTSIIPLCKKHHEFAHNGLISNETGEPENWEMNMLNRGGDPSENIGISKKVEFVDELFHRYSKH